MKKLAVTGGLAAGKTSVCRILKDLGAYVVSADEIVHQLLSPNTAIGQQVIDLIGSDIIHNNQIDRKKIAQKVFTDFTQLRALENILHPAVFDTIHQQYEKIKAQNCYSLFVAEIPLLYESESHQFFDAIVAVIADPAICRQRHPSTEEYELRMKRQIPQDEKAAKANFIIVNNGDWDELKRNVNKFLKELHLQ